MKKKLIILICLAVIFCFVFSACDKAYDNYSDMAPGGGNYAEKNSSQSDDSTPNLDPGQEEAVPQRKIIYSATIYMSDGDFSGRIAKIRAALNADEWFDSETVESDYAYFTVRVKSSRLDAFLTQISEGATVGTMQKEAKDISLNYQNKEDRIAALNEEKNLLTTYLESGAVTADYAIARIAEINTEIKRINGELKTYDSLIEYSTVTIRLSKTYAPIADPTYGERAGNTWSDTWQALGDFFRFLGLAVVAVFPGFSYWYCPQERS